MINNQTRDAMNYRNQKGQALVEMALVIFLLFLLVFGITEFGRAMYHWNSLNNAARAGARCGAVSKPYNPDAIRQCAKDAVFAIRTSAVTVDPDSGTPTTGATITVTVTAPFNPVVSFIPITNTLTGTASMRYE